MSNYSQNDRGLDSHMHQEPSSNRGQKHHCECGSCKNCCSGHHHHSSNEKCHSKPGRGSVWYPSNQRPEYHTSRKCCNKIQLECTCRVRQHSDHKHCHRNKDHRNSCRRSNFWF